MRAEPVERNAGGNHLQAPPAVSEEARNLFRPGVSVGPGLTAFTRMRRSFQADAADARNPSGRTFKVSQISPFAGM
jgi:hypothetical protein